MSNTGRQMSAMEERKGLQGRRKNPEVDIECLSTRYANYKRLRATTPTPSIDESLILNPATPVNIDAFNADTPRFIHNILDENLQISIRQCLEVFQKNLVILQPLVFVTEDMLVAALDILQSIVHARPILNALMKASGKLAVNYAAAALWLAIKLLGTRPASPNRSLMSKASHCNPEALTATEMEICVILDWEVSKAVRSRQTLLEEGKTME